MKTSGWIIVGIILVVVGGIGVVSALASVDRETRSETFQDVTEVIFDVENGSVDIVPGGGEALVEMTLTSGFFQPDVELRQDGGTLRIVQDCRWFAFGCGASFDMSLPEGTVVSGGTSNGGLSVTGISGMIDVTTSNGAITLDDLSGDVSVRTSNGAIRGSDLSTPSLEARTSNGRIELSFAEAPTTVTARTSNGTVDVVLPSDAPAYAVSTSTSNGEVSSEVRTDPTAAESIDIDTSNGDISIRYAS